MTEEIKSITAGYRAFIGDKTIKQNFLAPFVSMVQDCILKIENCKFTAEEIYEKVKSDYKTEIPPLPMKQILLNLSKQKIISKIRNRAEYRVLDTSKIEEENRLFFSEFHAFQSDFIILAHKCISFWKEKYGRTVVLEETIEVLERFLMQQSINILGKKTEKNHSTQDSFLVASFIKEECLGNPQYEELLMKIALGYILTENITFAKISTENLKSTEFVLDTPFIFHLIGINPLNTQNIYIDIVQSLLEQGAQLSIFRHTLDEIEQSLATAEHWIDNPLLDYSKISTTLEYYLKESKNKADIVEDRANLKSKVLGYNILTNDIDFSEKNHRFMENEENIYDCIIDVYKQTSPFFDESANRQIVQTDATSINGIYILRHGSTSVDLANCKAVLVSNNYSLSFASQNYNQLASSAQHTFPPVITDIYLGTKLWLDNPAKLGKITNDQLVAQVFASFRPTDTYWNRFLEELQKCEEKGTISEEESYLLKSTMVSGQLALELTAGDIRQITEKTPLQICRQIKEDARFQGILEERAKSDVAAEIKDKEYKEKIDKLEEEKKIESQQLSDELERAEREKNLKTAILKNKAVKRAKLHLRISKMAYLIIMIVIYFLLNKLWQISNSNNSPDYFGFAFSMIRSCQEMFAISLREESC